MGNRPKVPTALEEQVLTASRRRCSLCFGLNRDTNIKKGQIAHLDGDRENNSFDNLVFLCLEHHAEYDSRSPQTKGITPAELRTYRRELYASIDSEWSKPAPFFQPSLDPLGALAGHYVMEGAGSSAELQLTHLGNGVMQVSGLALWRGPTSAHTGSMDFVSDLRDDRLYFADRIGDDWYNLELRVRNGLIQASESSNTGYHGMNVSFGGTYRRIS